MSDLAEELRTLFEELRSHRSPRSWMVDRCNAFLAGVNRIYLDRQHLDERGMQLQDLEIILEALSKANTTSSTTYLEIDDFRETQLHQQIADVIQNNSSITRLVLFGNNLGNDSCIRLANALKTNKTITDLVLCYNKIEKEGGREIAEFLKTNDRLTKLDMCGNAIENEGCIAIAVALESNTVLLHLDLHYNNIGKEGALQFAKTLALNKTITRLNFSFNYIGEEGFDSFIDVLQKHNTTLTEFVVNHTEADQRERIINHYLSLNIAGRKIMMSEENSETTAEEQVEALIRNYRDIDIALSFLLLRPELCKQDRDHSLSLRNENQRQKKRKRNEEFGAAEAAASPSI